MLHGRQSFLIAPAYEDEPISECRLCSLFRREHGGLFRYMGRMTTLLPGMFGPDERFLPGHLADGGQRDRVALRSLDDGAIVTAVS